MSPIQKKYESLGGTNGFLGTAISVEIPLSNGSGIYQEFQGGMIYYSPDYGACVLRLGITNKWKSEYMKELTSDGKTIIRDFLGFPIRDTEINNRGGEVAYFERGMIVSSSASATIFNTFVVYGSNYVSYKKFGDINGWMGYPILDQEPRSGGNISAFEHSQIYWHPSLGAFEVHGDIAKKYFVLSEEKGFLGFPISDESDIVKDNQVVGKINHFQGGSIYWSANTGSFEVHGNIAEAYTKLFHGSIGELGFPTSDEFSSRNGTFRISNFQNGILACDMRNGTVKKISKIKLFVTKLETDEDDDDLFVKATAELSAFRENQVIKVVKDFGEYSNTGTKTLDENEGFVTEFDLRDGNAVLSISMKAWDIDGGFNFGDDTIAEFTKSFDIETLWDATFPDLQGNNLQTWYKGEDGKFRADLRIEIDDFEVNPFDKENFRKNLFWNFLVPKKNSFEFTGNPTFDELTFNNFADTFSDVERDDTPFFHPFNHLYFQAVYEHSAENGTCFGSCLEAIYALKNRSASRQPIAQYSFDEQRKQDIIVKFGYQLGASQINYILRNARSGDLWNPKHQFILSRELFRTGNYGILCLSKDALSFSDAHAVVPYHWDDSNPDEWIIYVANPNNPPSKGSAEAQNDFRDAVVKINTKENIFTYRHSDTSTWIGGEGFLNSGRMFTFPYNELSTEPHTPFWEVILTLLTGGAYILMAGDTDVKQITDGKSNTFFDELGNENMDKNTRIPNLLPVRTWGMPDDEQPIFKSKFKGNTFSHQKIKDVLKLTTTSNSQAFFYKTSSPKIKMYEDSHIFSDSITFKNTHLTAHIATTIQSKSFSKKLNIENFTNELDHSKTNIFKVDEILKSKFFRSNNLEFSLKGKKQGDFTFGLISGKNKILISSPTTHDINDIISVNNFNQAGQAITFNASSLNTESRKIKIIILNFNNQRMYEISNLDVFGGQSITLQHNDSVNELILHNSQQDINFDLKLFWNNFEQPVLEKTNITMNHDEVLQLCPEIKENQFENFIKIDVFDKLGGNLLHSKII